MRIQSTHTSSDRGLDAYFTPPEATLSLLAIEPVPSRIWEPACGDGAISKLLLKAGHNVVSSDIHNYGFKGTLEANYLKCFDKTGVQGIITNPPFKLAQEFAEKAISEVPYVALLLRTNFLESLTRLPFFRATPPARVWISARRLPMMHRHGWTGPEAPSNTCFAWFVWDSRERDLGPQLRWFDWEEHCGGKQSDQSADDLGL